MNSRNWLSIVRQWSVLPSTALLSAALALVASSYAMAEAAWLRPFLFKKPAELFYPAVVTPAVPRPVVDVPETFYPALLPLLGASSVAAYRRDWVVIEMGTDIDTTSDWAASVSPGLLAVLGLAPELGRAFATTDDVGQVAMLSHSAWLTVFGGRPDVAGMTVVVDGVPREIVGVAPETMTLPGIAGYRLLLPLTVPAEAGPLDAARSARLLVRSSLPADRLRDQVRAVLAPLLRDAATPTAPETFRVTALPLDSVVESQAAAFPAFLGMSGSIFLLALINVTYLATTNIVSRLRAVAIRSALGAPAWRLRWFVYYRLALPWLLAGPAGLLLADLALKALGADVQSSTGLSRPPSLTSSTVLVCALTFAGTGTFWVAAIGTRIVTRAASGGIIGSRDSVGGPFMSLRTRQAALASQAACAAVLVTATIVVAGMFIQLVSTDLGLEPIGVFGTTFVAPDGSPAQSDTVFAAIAAEMRAVPGISHVAFTDVLPFTAFPNRSPVSLPGGDTAETKVRYIDAGYLDLFDMDLVAGRGFTQSDEVSPPAVALVSRRFADERLGGTVVDAVVKVGDELSLQVVGVVEDVRDQDVDRPAEPMVYVPLSDRGYSKYHIRAVLVRLDGTDTTTVRAADGVLAAWSGPDAGARQFRALSELMSDVFVTPRTYASMTALFGFLAMALSVAGTYVVAAHLGASRRREIAVRVACGATPSSIAMMLLKEIAPPVSGGLIVGVAGGAVMVASLSDSVFQAAGVQPWALGLALVLLACGAAVAVLLPGMRIGHLDPIREL